MVRCRGDRPPGVMSPKSPVDVELLQATKAVGETRRPFVFETAVVMSPMAELGHGGKARSELIASASPVGAAASADVAEP